MSHKHDSKGGGAFAALGLSKPLLKALYKKGYKQLTPIQRKTIPLALEGKDVVGMSRTGSGKTLAFLIPMVEKLNQMPGRIGVKACIISPTRELALQTFKVTKEIIRFTSFKVVSLLGGDSMEKHFSNMHDNPDIIVATPGRLLHVLVEMKKKLTQCEFVVLDECDRLFELGFSEQLNELLNRFPESKQTLLFSATLPQMVVDFAQAGLISPVLVRLDTESKLSENLTSHFLSCKEIDKPAIILYLLRNCLKKNEMTVIFVPTKHHVEYLKHILDQCGIENTYIYSSLDAEARKTNIQDFRSRKVRTLVVTDVASRGIDIPFLDNVINYNFPSKPKLYVHRVGRVARAGRTGNAYSLVSFDEAAFAYELHMFLDKQIIFAKHLKNEKDVKDGIWGAVPQEVVDLEQESFSTFSDSSEMNGLKKVAFNATKQYIKTRSLPSGEAVKKVKEFLNVGIGIHPIFENIRKENKREGLLEGLKKYKPKSTIFEISGNKSKINIMKDKRKFHNKLVLKEEMKKSNEQADEIINTNVKDDYYLPYKSDNLNWEKGLQIEKDNKFCDATFEINGDDEKTLGLGKKMLKWDRKRKRFIKDEENKKKKRKIKTESGNWISESYSSGFYKKWVEKNKMLERENKDEDEDDADCQDFSRNEIKKRNKEIEKSGIGKKKGKIGLINRDQIVKNRIKASKKKKFIAWRRNEKMKRRRKH